MDAEMDKPLGQITPKSLDQANFLAGWRTICQKCLFSFFAFFFFHGDKLSSSLLNTSTPKLPSFPSFPTLNNPIFLVPPKLHFPTKLYSFSPSFLSSHTSPSDDDIDDEDSVIGDCFVFEDGAFEDLYLQSDFKFHNLETKIKSSKTKSRKKKLTKIEPENLVPEQWKHVLDEVNITKKERHKIAQQLEFRSKVQKKRRGMVLIRNVNVQEHWKFKAEKVA